MTCSLFIVTCAAHKHWIRPCLHCVRRYCSGFSEVVILVPEADKSIVEALASGYDVSVKTFNEIAGHGFNHHQAMICCADKFCTGNFVLHLDIDCLFTEPVNIQDEYFVKGKPILLKDSYKNLSWHSQILEWQRTTENALGFKCDWEIMRRHPAVHYRWAYRFLREHVEKLHSVPFVDFFVSKPERVGISEFNVLGSFVHQECNPLYHFVDIGKMPRPRDRLVQAVSYWPVDQNANGPMTKDILQWAGFNERT